MISKFPPATAYLNDFAKSDPFNNKNLKHLTDPKKAAESMIETFPLFI